MHIGPMAQDFYKLFNLGNDDKSISTIDPSGIALAAIKEQQKIIDSQQSAISGLKLTTTQQEIRIKKLEELLGIKAEK